jgi:hypothetical protein
MEKPAPLLLHSPLSKPICMTSSNSFGSVQGVVDFHWTALTMGILPDESLDAFFAFLAIFGL